MRLSNKRIVEIDPAMSKADSRLLEIERLIKDKTKELESFKQESENFFTIYEGIQVDIKRAKENLISLETAIKNKQTEIQTLSEEVISVSNSKQELITQVNSVENQIAEKRVTVINLDIEHQTLLKTKEEIRVLTEQISEINHQKAMALSELSSIQVDIQDTKVQIESLKEKFSLHYNEVETVTSELKTLKGDKDILLSEIAHLQSERERINLAIIAEEESSKNRVISIQEREKVRIAEIISESDKEAEERKNELERLHLIALEKQRIELQMFEEQKEFVKIQLQKHESESQERCDKMVLVEEEKKRIVASEVFQLEASKATLRAEIEDARQELVRTKENIKAEMKHLDDKKASIDGYKNSILLEVAELKEKHNLDKIKKMGLE